MYKYSTINTYAFRYRTKKALKDENNRRKNQIIKINYSIYFT